jgi:hypothetical protein
MRPALEACTQKTEVSVDFLNFKAYSRAIRVFLLGLLVHEFVRVMKSKTDPCRLKPLKLLGYACLLEITIHLDGPLRLFSQ